MCKCSIQTKVAPEVDYIDSEVIYNIRALFTPEEQRDRMVDTRVKTLIRVPEFRKDNIQGYIDVLRMWQFITDMDKKKQAPVVWMTLPEEDSSNIRDLVHQQYQTQTIKGR